MYKNVLIVDDEPLQAKLFEKFIKNAGNEVVIINSGQETIDFFHNKIPINNIVPSDLDVMILDLSMPDLDGFEVLKEIEPIKGDLQIIVLTASNDVSQVVKAIGLGAFDYIVKGEKDIVARVISAIDNAVEKRNLKYQVSNLERRDYDQILFSDIIGRSQSLLNSINLAKKIANSNMPILIEGQNGVGKEVMARAIHGSSVRSEKPFIMVDCKSLQANMSDNILFGYEKILSDKSIEKNIGKIREANGGTILLSNIEDLKFSTQLRLLNFLQEGIIESVGSKSIYRAGTRIICTTRQDLKSLVDKAKFREELYYQLTIFPIYMPSLQERGEDDIKLLAENFCHNFSINENKKIKGISPEALQLLYEYDWEGNVKQLRSYIFRAVVLCDGEFLKLEHFPHINHILSRSARLKSVKDDLSKDARYIGLFANNGKCKTLEEIETEIAKKLMEYYQGNLSKVAQGLKVGRSTIYRKLLSKKVK